MTTAQKIAKRFGDDGQIFEDDNGQTLHDVCSEHGTYEQNVEYLRLDKNLHPPCEDATGTFDEVYSFQDGSYIAVSGGCWDVSDARGGSWYDRGYGCFIDVAIDDVDYDYEQACERQVSNYLFWDE